MLNPYNKVQFSSVAQSCPTLCDPMIRSTLGLPVHHRLLTSIESMMPSSHLILGRPLLLLPPIPASIRVFSNESTLCIFKSSIFKSRGITLPTKVHLVKAMYFPVVMYGCESWTIKKAKHQRIDAFELWCWRRLLRVPWTARSNSQS